MKLQVRRRLLKMLCPNTNVESHVIYPIKLVNFKCNFLSQVIMLNSFVLVPITGWTFTLLKNSWACPAPSKLYVDKLMELGNIINLELRPTLLYFASSYFPFLYPYHGFSWKSYLFSLVKILGFRTKLGSSLFG